MPDVARLIHRVLGDVVVVLPVAHPVDQVQQARPGPGTGARGQLDLELAGQVPLAILPVFRPEIRSAEGLAGLTVRVNGTTQSPRIAGEATIRDGKIQLADYQRVFPVFWEHPAVRGITLWGYRPGHWRSAQGAYLVLANGAERPAMLWLKQYVAETPLAAWVKLSALDQFYDGTPKPVTVKDRRCPTFTAAISAAGTGTSSSISERSTISNSLASMPTLEPGSM